MLLIGMVSVQIVATVEVGREAELVHVGPCRQLGGLLQERGQLRGQSRRQRIVVVHPVADRCVHGGHLTARDDVRHDAVEIVVPHP